jgi:hypothetical protein
MPIEVPQKVGAETRGEIIATVVGDPGTKKGDKTRGEMELLVDGETKARKWTSFKADVIEAIQAGRLPKGTRWVFTAYMKKTDMGFFRNIDAIKSSAVDVAPPAVTAAAIANGPKSADDYTDKERAMNRRTALMQAVAMVSSKDTIESGPLPLTLVFADAFYEWLERTNQPPGGAEAPLSTPEASAQEEAVEWPAWAGFQNNDLDQTLADMEEVGYTRIAFRKWAHEERGINWQQPQKPTDVIPLIGEFMSATVETAD